MQVTILGYLSIAITIFILLSRKYIRFLYVSVFFCGFTGSSVINIGDFSLQPSFCFFSLYFIFYLISGAKLKIRIDKLLLLFVAYCTCSIVLPFIVSNNVMLTNQEGEYVTLCFSSSNITQVCYLLFDALFLNALLRYKGNLTVGNKLIKAFKIGYCAVVIVCLYQLIAVSFDLEFDAIFRQNVNLVMLGSRLCGPTLEASMLGYYLITGLIIFWQQNKKFIDYIVMVVAVAIGVISYSSTFLMGIILCFIFFFVDYICYKKSRIGGLFAILCVMAVIAVVLKDEIYRIFEEAVSKIELQNKSGVTRWETFQMMAHIGFVHPFGVGFGSARSNDLLSTWLCNIGLIGTGIFVVYLIQFILCKKGKNRRYSLPFVMCVILMFVSVPEPYNLFVWFALFYGNTMFAEKNTAPCKAKQNISDKNLIRGAIYEGQR